MPPPPLSGKEGGRTLDEHDFMGGQTGTSLELGAQPASRRGLVDGTGMGSDNVMPSSRASGQMSVVTPPASFRASDARARPGVFAFAGFGLPPEGILGTPAYALRFFERRRILRRGLATSKARGTSGSSDAALYEAALATADRDAVTKGTTLLALMLGVAITSFVIVAQLL